MAEHQKLDDEFDIDQSAAVMLEIEQRAAVGVVVDHLLAHRQHLVAQRGQIARLAQHLDAYRLEGRAECRIAGREPGARQRLVFPHPGRFHLIRAKGFQRTDQLPGVAVGAQSQVGFEHRAGRCRARQPGVHALRQARVDIARVRVVVVEQENDVQVRGVAEFLAAELAVAHHREARRVPMALAQLAPDGDDGQLEHDVGELGQVVGEVLDRQQAGQILRQQAEHLRMVRFAHQVHLALGVRLDRVQAGGEAVAEGYPVGRCLQGARIKQFVEQ